MQNRLAQSRKSTGLSLRPLADQVGVSAMALSKYERGLITPSPPVLSRLAQALGVSINYLQGENIPTLQGVEYRAAGRLTPISKKRIHASLIKQIEARFEAEELLPNLRPKPFTLPRMPKRVDSLESIEPIAQSMRKHWQLGNAPIPNLTNLLETHGVRTFITPTKDEHFDGLSAHYGDTPIVATGSGWPGDRQRFTLAHELGHLVLENRLAPHLDEERACHRFAGAFLAPSSSFGDRFTKDATNPFSFYMLKHEWGLSMRACLYRCSDLGLMSQLEVRRWWARFRKRGWVKQEPGEPIAREHPTQVLRLLVDAYVAGRLAKDLVATLLDVPPDVLDQIVDFDLESDSGA